VHLCTRRVGRDKSRPNGSPPARTRTWRLVRRTTSKDHFRTRGRLAAANPQHAATQSRAACDAETHTRRERRRVHLCTRRVRRSKSRPNGSPPARTRTRGRPRVRPWLLRAVLCDNRRRGVAVGSIMSPCSSNKQAGALPARAGRTTPVSGTRGEAFSPGMKPAALV